MRDGRAMTTQSDPAVLTGGCQCGAVRFAAKPLSNEAYYCHCRMCRRAFGNIFATFINLPKANVTWETREPDYFASSKIARRGFCSRCGTPLTFEYNESQHLDLSVGSLDQPEGLTPVMHVGVDGRLAAFAHADGLPEKRIEDFEHIVAKWKAAYGPDATPGTWATTQRPAIAPAQQEKPQG
jgi:hypothetical protein